MLRRRHLWIFGGVLVAGGAALAAVRAHRRAERIPAGAVVLHVPRAPGTITVDGETDDPGWLAAPGPARTGNFHYASGETGRPYSEARIVWADGTLYLALYAADEDIRARVDRADGPLWLDDSFRLTFTHDGVERVIEVSPKCVLTDGRRRAGDPGPFDYSWSSGARVACDTDGTINNPADMDEEWVVEVALPLAAIGLRGERGESFALALQRCDTPKSSGRVCIFWGDGGRGWVVLE